MEVPDHSGVAIVLDNFDDAGAQVATGSCDSPQFRSGTWLLYRAADQPAAPSQREDDPRSRHQDSGRRNPRSAKC